MRSPHQTGVGVDESPQWRMRHKGEWISRSGGRAGVLIAAQKPARVGKRCFLRWKGVVFLSGLLRGLWVGYCVDLWVGYCVDLRADDCVVYGLAIAWISGSAIARIY